MRRLLSPKWVAAHIVVVVVAVVFVNLGLWQLRRLDEKRQQNLVGESRFSSEPIDVATLVDAAGPDTDSLEYRRATATGEFDPDNEVLIRSQVHLDVAGFHVITPLVQADGTVILVNRGWVPLTMDQVPVVDAPPPTGTVTVEGWLRPTQERPPLGHVDPAEGRLVAMSRVDIDRIQEQVPYPLDPVYLIVTADEVDQFPIPVDLPTFSDEGPHLGYAIQWFSFTVIGLFGYGALMRRSLLRSG